MIKRTEKPDTKGRQILIVKDSDVMCSLKIMIVGKCLDQEYKLKLDGYLLENIIHFDKNYDIEEIASSANQAKFTLFTYKLLLQKN